MTTGNHIKLPKRMARLPKDEHGRPVPYFVAWIDGKPDFRVMDELKWFDCVQLSRCWVCGEPLGSYKSFLVGPMCAVNRVSAEPPSHTECAETSAMICPFLTVPRMKRRERHIPEGAGDPAGFMIRRNPGVALVWITKDYKLEREGSGYLIRMGEPIELRFYSEGRAATLEEVRESIDSGLPSLTEVAERQGPHAVKALERSVEVAMRLIEVQVI